jgi:CheY-like chemotaxis protein
MAEAKLILVVDYDYDIREALQEALEDAGYKVAVAVNGRAALELMETGPMPALILLDLMMPVMNGEEFIQIQQEDPTLAHIPVVILTANGRIKEKATSLRTAGYMHKPFTLEDLLAIARQFAG